VVAGEEVQASQVDVLPNVPVQGPDGSSGELQLHADVIKGGNYGPPLKKIWVVAHLQVLMPKFRWIPIRGFEADTVAHHSQNLERGGFLGGCTPAGVNNQGHLWGSKSWFGCRNVEGF